MGTYRSRPVATADGNSNDTAPGRHGIYGDAYTMGIGSATNMVVCDEGSYFTAITPTPGTGIIGHAAPTTFDETKPYISVYNGTGFRLYPQFLRLHDTVVSVGGARVQFTIVTDSQNRYSSGGTALTVSNTNMDTSTSGAGVAAYVGAVTASAATGNRRVLDHIVFRGTIDVVEDVYEIIFGGVGGAQAVASRPATVVDATRVTAPVCIGPGQWFGVHQWAGSQSTGPTFQVCLGFILR